MYAEGTPEVRSYTTNEGKTGASLSLRISSVQLLGGGRSSNEQDGGQSYNQGNTYAQQPAPLAAAAPVQDTSDDLPF